MIDLLQKLELLAQGMGANEEQIEKLKVDALNGQRFSFQCTDEGITYWFVGDAIDGVEVADLSEIFGDTLIHIGELLNDPPTT